MILKQELIRIHCQKNKICLEVNINNFAARSFYYNLGFKEVGIRERYYNNKDDAILMNLRV